MLSYAAESSRRRAVTQTQSRRYGAVPNPLNEALVSG